MKSLQRRVSVLTTVMCLSLLAWTEVESAQVKNVIVMIGDGSGYSCWQAASMYRGRWNGAQQRSTEVYDGVGWSALACSTYPLNTASKPSGKGTQDTSVIYDPEMAWSTTADRETVGSGEKAKEVEIPAGYKWLKAGYTDSAASSTALSTGQKTYNAAINWSDLDQKLGPTASELAKAHGKSTGVVTSVQWSHATPAGFADAHVTSRNSYEEIANQMLSGDVLDVIMGCGNPDFDDNGQPQQKKEFKYVGGEQTWRNIEIARQQSDGLYGGFRPVATKAEFEALLTGPVPARVLGTAQVAQTLQAARVKAKPQDGADGTADSAAMEPAYTQPFIASVPSLKTMTVGALRVLNTNPQGMFLMVEGGAIDWANHNNHGGRMIEEQIAFVETIEAVVDWIERNSSWDETLLIITADHETGLLWGPESKTRAFDPVVDHGAGRMPGFAYNSTNHTNSLVPLFLRGAGSELFPALLEGTDPVRGPYVANTSIAEIIHQVLSSGEPAAPEATRRQ